jgi:hypothetical protein
MPTPPSNRHPQEPFTELQESAAQVHEYHLSLVSAGFTEQQALYLTGQLIRALVAKAQ